VAKIINKDLLRSYHSKTCIICNAQAEPHHIYHRSQHHGLDIDDNLLPLCRIHHARLHQGGLTKFVEHFPSLESILFTKGWEFDIYNQKWQNYDILEQTYE